MSEETKNKLMSTTTAAPAVPNYEEEDDGLSSFSLEQLGKKVSAFGGARILKFVSGKYVTGEGEPINSQREFILLGLVKVVQKFISKKLVDTKIVPTREKFPDIDAMNEAAPREEWGVDPGGKPQGPYNRVLVLKLLDATTLDRFAFVTKSIAGMIAFGDISDKIKLIRRLKGANVTAAIACETVRMKSQYNPHGVPRPHFRIVRYVKLGGEAAALPPAQAKTLPPSASAAPPMTARPPMTAAAKLDVFAGESDAPATTPISTASPVLDLPTVSQPSLKEELGDELPF
jgi:hypothetical protein